MLSESTHVAHAIHAVDRVLHPAWQIEARFGRHADKVMREMDHAIYNFIQQTEFLTTPNGPKEAMKDITLDKYMESRMWTGGLVPCAGIFWYGHHLPEVWTGEAFGIFAFPCWSNGVTTGLIGHCKPSYR